MRLFWFPTVCCISFVCYTFSLLWAWTDCDTAKQLALTEWTTERRGSKRLWTHHQPEMSRTVFLSGRNLTHRKKKKAKLLHIVDCMDTHASILSHYTSCCKVQCSYWWRIKVSFSFSTQAASFFVFHGHCRQMHVRSCKSIVCVLVLNKIHCIKQVHHKLLT